MGAARQWTMRRLLPVMIVAAMMAACSGASVTTPPQRTANDADPPTPVASEPSSAPPASESVETTPSPTPNPTPALIDKDQLAADLKSGDARVSFERVRSEASRPPPSSAAMTHWPMLDRSVFSRSSDREIPHRAERAAVG